MTEGKNKHNQDNDQQIKSFARDKTADVTEFLVADSDATTVSHPPFGRFIGLEDVP
jgi:hypothetical protein